MSEHTAKFSRERARHAVLAVCGLAFFLRVLRLGDKDVWWDEGWSVYLARQDAADVVRRSASTLHPPLHYLYLHLWLPLAGESEFALRFTSAAFALLAVALLARVGFRLLGRRAAVLAALLLSVAPFHIAWSQEIRMYSPAVAFALLALDRLLLARDGQRLAWAGYAASALAGLFTAYVLGLFLFLANVAVAVPVALSQGKMKRSFCLGWLAANASIAVVLAPWLLLYLRRGQGGDPSEPLAPAHYAQLCLSLLSVGASVDVARYALVGTALAALGALGLLRGFRRPRDALLVATLLIGFPAVLYLLSLPRGVPYAPRIEDRYLLLAQPSYALALAAGLACIWRRVAALGLLASTSALAVVVAALPGYYSARHSDRQLRALGTFVAATADAGDLVVVNPDKDWPVFAYYLGPSVDLKGLPYRERMTPEAAAHWLAPWTQSADSVWLLTTKEAATTDPDGAVRDWLRARFREVATTHFRQTALTVYSRAPEDADVFGVSDGGSALWRQASLSLPGAELEGFAFVPRVWRTGDVVQVVALWTSTGLAKVEADLRLVLADVRSGQPLVTGAWERFLGRVPTTWPEGRQAITVVGLPVPHVVTTGSYLLRLETRAANSEELTWVDVRRILVHQVGVGGPPADGPQQPLEVDLGGEVRLLGYDLPSREVSPEGHLRLTLYWQALRPMAKSYSVFVHVARPDERMAFQADREPQDGAYSTVNWSPSEVVVDSYDLVAPEGLAEGEYRLFVGMYDPTTLRRLAVQGSANFDGSDRVYLGQVRVVVDDSRGGR